MLISIQAIIARIRAWLGRAKTPAQEQPEEPIYHILPHPEDQPLPHNEEYFTYKQPDAGQSASTTKGPEYRDGQRK